MTACGVRALSDCACRRKTIILQSAKQKEEEELAQCTFQPSIPRESEALAVKAFAEEYQHFLEEQRTYQHLESSDGIDTEGDLETSRLSQKSGEKSDDEVWISCMSLCDFHRALV